jgi:hypothetical protein
MKKQLWQSFAIAPIILGGTIIANSPAIADPVDTLNSSNNSPVASQATAPLATALDLPQLPRGQAATDILMRRYQMKPTENAAATNSVDQVTSVSQLKDVQPTEWAFEALRSLVERYGCIVGYPDRTFRGNRALTRWEFAAGLNACINSMERLLNENVAVLREDIDKLKKLAEQFRSELAALGTRIDNLEERVAFLEDHNFSTTTKLRGSAIFMVDQAFSENFQALSWRQQGIANQGNNFPRQDVQENTVFGFRARLNLESSFTGTDLLRTRLQAGTIANLSTVTGTNSSRLQQDTGFNASTVIIDDLWYRFKLGNITAWVGANSLDLDDVFEVGNPYLASGDTGALSRFARFNPLLYRGPSGAGAAIKYQFDKSLQITATYLANSGNNQAANPSQGNGLFNGAFSAGAQIGYTPFDNLKLAATYVHSYFNAGSGFSLAGGTGSAIAENPFCSPSSTTGACSTSNSAAATRDSYGLQGDWKVAPFLNISAWGAYALATSRGYTFGSGGRYQIQPGFGADLWTWSAALNFLDIGKQGAVLSLSGGQAPRAARVAAYTGQAIAQDQNSNWLIETQYKYPVNKNITITPGFYVLLNPNSNSNNNSIWVAALRTAFSF